jgi:hypothetical protein
LFLPFITYTLFDKIRDKGKIVSDWYQGGGEVRERGGGRGKK